MSAEFDPKKTQPYSGEESPKVDRTRILGVPGSGEATPGSPPPFDPKRTHVMGQGGAAVDPGKTQIYQGPGVSPQRQVPQNRKLVGWLVSFTLHPNGVDFRLYEGRNTIGSRPDCDIVLQDAQVSGHHLTILYRAGKYRFKDELSTNGTFVNGEMVDEGELQDGDILKIGTVEMKFRTV